MPFFAGIALGDLPPMLRLVVLASLPALVALALVFTRSIAIAVGAISPRGRGAEAIRPRPHRRVTADPWGTID